MNPARRNDMKHTRRAVNTEYGHFKSMNLIDESKGPFFKILDKKIKGLPLRAYFMRKTYDYLTAGKEVNQIVPSVFFTHRLPFIAEAIISIQYYHNQILDGKGGVDNLEKAGVNAIKANLLKDALFLYLETATDDKPINDYLIKEVRSIFMLVDSGQFIERHCGIYTAWEKNTSPQHQFEELTDAFIDKGVVNQVMECVMQSAFFNEIEINFIRKYIERIYLTNGALYIKLVSVIFELLSVEKDEKFIRFVALFAIMHQIVNDNGDFVPSEYQLCTEVKMPQDALSDLKTGTMTLPLCIHLKKCPDGKNRYIFSSSGEKNE
jgi:hypothetical protein